MNFTGKQILGFFAALFAVGFASSFFLPPELVFHIANPLSIAMGIVLVIVYGRGVVDAFRHNGTDITPAHLLTFGVTLNWIGIIIRMGRWYVTGEHPIIKNDTAFWVYNAGLWVSIWGGLCLIGALRLTAIPTKPGTIAAIFLVIFAVLLHLGASNLSEPISNLW